MSQTIMTDLVREAKSARQRILEMCVNAGEGRGASVFSCT